MISSPGSLGRSALKREYKQSYKPIARNGSRYYGSISAGDTRPKIWSSRTHKPGRAPQQSTTARMHHVVVWCRERTLLRPRHLTTSVPEKERVSAHSFSSIKLGASCSTTIMSFRRRKHPDVSPHEIPSLITPEPSTSDRSTSCMPSSGVIVGNVR